MSHRVTSKSEIKNKDAACTALKNAGWDYSVQGNRIRVESGPMHKASIDLNTGEIVGDTDYHSTESLRALHQGYSEALWTQNVLSEGGYIVDRQVEGQDIVLYAQVSMA